ncbi:MAG: hypothetical protein AAF074_17070 [Pseudomonadota bacterium]
MTDTFSVGLVVLLVSIVAYFIGGYDAMTCHQGSFCTAPLTGFMR